MTEETRKRAEKAMVRIEGSASAKIAAGSATGKSAAKSPAKAAAKITAGKAVKKSTAKPAVKTGAKSIDKTAVKAADTGKMVKGKSQQDKRPDAAVQPVDWQAFIAKMEESLLGQRAEIRVNLSASNNDFKQIVEGMDPKDLADSASDDIDRKMIEAVGSKELNRLKAIDAALIRIKQGKYGLCVKCDKRIPPARLEALPYALMCVECKSEEERRTR